jgi:hypothetical protein
MSTTESIRPGEGLEPQAVDGLPRGTHVAWSRQADTLNRALLDGFNTHQHDAGIKRTHLFNGRYENIYLTAREVPAMQALLDEAGEYASRILGIAGLQAGCWFNHMPPGAVTTVHSHDDHNELLSAVYYVSVPRNSGSLIIHDRDTRHEITPEEGKFVFFSPDVVHEVSENKSGCDRLSIAINFGRGGDDRD